MVCHMVSKYRYNSCGIYQYNNLKSSAAIYGTVYQYLSSFRVAGLRRGLKVFNVFIIIYWENCLFIIGK